MKTTDPFVIFLHIPKAGGTTLHKLLARWCHRREIVDAGAQSAEETKAILRARSALQPPGVRVIVGHAPFGLHEALAGPARYVTLLREPVARFLSNFHFARRNPRHRFYEAINRGEIGLLDLAKRLSNLQTRYLGGRPQDAPDAAALERAKERIVAHFAVAGLVERFDETAVLLHRAFARPLRSFTSENVGEQRAALETLGGNERADIVAAHELDSALYSFVRERLEEQIAGQDPSFEREVAKLSRGNRLANYFARLLPQRILRQ